MTTDDALTTILRQFQSTGDIEQAKKDITGIMSSALEDTFEDTCSKCRKDETHYLVPKDLLRTTYAKIEGIIIDKNLHPSQCGYTAEIWTVRQKLKEIIKYGD